LGGAPIRREQRDGAVQKVLPELDEQHFPTALFDRNVQADI